MNPVAVARSRAALVALVLATGSLAVACQPGESDDPVAGPDARVAPGAEDLATLVAASGRKLLILEKKGNGVGTVRGPDFECGPDCPYLEVEYDEGAQITLTAEADVQDDRFSRFATWAVDCTGTDPGGCALRFDRSRKVEVVFVLDGTLTVNRVGVAGGTVVSTLDDGSPGPIDCGERCGARFAQPTRVTLTAPEAPRKGGVVKLLRWGGACFGSQPTCTIDIAGGHLEVNAEFRNALRIVPAGDGAATFRVVKRSDADPDEYVIDCGPDCEGLYSAADEVLVEAIPAPGSDLTSWGSLCSAPTAITQPCRIKMDRPRTLQPVVSRRVEVRITADPPAAGTITATSDGRAFSCVTSPSSPTCVFAGVVRGSQVTFRAMAGPNHVLAAWTGCTADASGQCSVIADGDRAVRARFETRFQVRVRLLARPSDGRVIVSTHPSAPCTGACTFTYPARRHVTLTHRGIGRFDECWSFYSWGGACETGAATCTLDVDDVKDVTATWRRDPGCPQ